ARHASGSNQPAVAGDGCAGGTPARARRHRRRPPFRRDPRVHRGDSIIAARRAEMSQASRADLSRTKARTPDKSGAMSARALVAMAGRRGMRGLASHPYLSALEMLLLPDRHDFLEAVNCETARLEGLAPMGCGDGDRDRSLAEIDDADAMGDRDAHDRPSSPRLARDLAHLGQGHRLVRLVFEAD